MGSGAAGRTGRGFGPPRTSGAAEPVTCRRAQAPAARTAPAGRWGVWWGDFAPTPLPSPFWGPRLLPFPRTQVQVSSPHTQVSSSKAESKNIFQDLACCSWYLSVFQTRETKIFPGKGQDLMAGYLSGATGKGGGERKKETPWVSRKFYFPPSFFPYFFHSFVFSPFPGRHIWNQFCILTLKAGQFLLALKTRIHLVPFSPAPLVTQYYNRLATF